MKVAYLILAHQHPELLARLIRRLLDANGLVAIHFDASCGDAFVSDLRALLGQDFGRLVLVDRVAVVWGEWSLVEATLNGLRAISQLDQQPDYVYLLSGSDYPIRPLHELDEFLERNRGMEFIESFDDRQHRWVKRGIQSERYLYRFPFNWGKNPRLFSLATKLQQMLGWTRRMPAGIEPHFGSQWWVLTWVSCEAILKCCDNPALVQFFRGTWVPDELFFQTMIRHVARPKRIRNHPLTLYQFSDSGTPVVYCNGHEDYLARQNFFFARKISPWADKLRDRLDELSSGDRQAYQMDDEKAGNLSSEYEHHCSVYGHGLYGKQVIGRVKDDKLGDLVWNHTPYFIVAGFSSRELAAFQSYLNSLDGWVCHGQLLHPDHIGFLDDADRHAGFSRQDVALRDNNIQNFLFQLLQHEGERMTGFLVNTVTQIGTFHKLLRDPQARVIILDGDPVLAFLESGEASNIPGVNDDRMHKGLVTEQDAVRKLFTGHYESSRKSLHVLNRMCEQWDTATLHLHGDVGQAGMSLTAEHLLAFYHGRFDELSRADDGNDPLLFATGITASTDYDYLLMTSEDVNQYMPGLLKEMKEPDEEFLQG